MAETQVKLKEVMRFVVIIDVTLQDIVLDEFIARGARGYNYVNATGKGEHEAVEDAFSGKSLVRIEVITTKEIAGSLMNYMHGPRFKQYPVTAYVHPVFIADTDHFADKA